MSADFTPEEMQRRIAALERLRSLRLPFPPGYKFDREEANSRDGLKQWIDSNGLPVKESESTPGLPE
jgi:hypothetical protein